ncbi:hypothetical protein HYW18_03835 [Candidatus Uhrbacteria bacterium]|nr:hypothetical protein [Candidatus Uhrbacteria bacterium]
MTSFALLFTLAAIGVAEARYLLHKRLAEEHPVCPIGGQCELVLNSEYNRTFGVHNDLLGLGFYTGLLVLTALVVLGVGATALWSVIAAMMVTGAAITSLYFIYIQARVVRAWCTWCLFSALTIFLMTAILITKGFILVL